MCSSDIFRKITFLDEPIAEIDPLTRAVNEAVDDYMPPSELPELEEEPAPDVETEEEEEDTIPDLLLGKLAGGRRTLGEGRGIGANILTSGSGVGSPNVRRRTLLG